MIANYLLHPLNGNGYQFWSGIGSDFGELTLFGFIATAITWWVHSRCHVDKCHKKGKYTFKHYKLCKLHHPSVPIGGVSFLHIIKLHKKGQK